MKVTRVVVSLLCAAACASFAVAVGRASQASMQGGRNSAQYGRPNVNLQNVQTVKLTRATSLRNVQKVRTEFLKGFDALASAGALASGGETTVVNTKVWRDAVDKTIYKTTNAAVTLASLPEAEVRELRSLISARFEESLRAGNVRSLGEGQVSKNFFTGKLSAPADAQGVRR